MKIHKIYNKKQIKTKAHVISKHPAPLEFSQFLILHMGTSCQIFGKNRQ